MIIDINILDKKRFEAFIDAIFAIVITFLILEFKMPHIEGADDATLKSEIWKMFPLFICYLLSFFTIMIIWLDHHRLFQFITKVTKPFAVLNFIFLIPVTAIPFATGLAGENIHSEFAMLFFILTLVIMNIIFAILFMYSAKQGLVEQDQLATFKKGEKIEIIGLLMSITSLFVVFIDPLFGFGLSFLVLVLHIFKIYMK